MGDTIAQRQHENREARSRDEFVGFLTCPHGGGRVVKVAMSSERERICVVCPYCGKSHETTDALPRPRRRGEECAVTLPDDPTAKPAQGRQLLHVSDDDFLAAIGSDDTPAPTVAKALDIEGTAAGSRIRTRAEWLNYDAKAERVIIIRQGRPKPTLLRRAETVTADA